VTEFGTAAAPSDGELRVAEAQLLGWLAGVVAAAEARILHQAALGEGPGVPSVAEAAAPTGPRREAPEGYL
jgi:proteasome activator-like protein